MIIYNGIEYYKIKQFANNDIIYSPREAKSKTYYPGGYTFFHYDFGFAYIDAAIRDGFDPNYMAYVAWLHVPVYIGYFIPCELAHCVESSGIVRLMAFLKLPV